MASITSLKLNDTSFTLGSDGENVEVVDTQGVVGTALEKTNLQSVIDYLCNKVKNELVTDNELTEKLTESLSSYLLKSAIVQAEGTSADTVPSSNLLKTLLDTIRSDVSELNSGIKTSIYSYLKYADDCDAPPDTISKIDASSLNTPGEGILISLNYGNVAWNSQLALRLNGRPQWRTCRNNTWSEWDDV